MELLLTLRKRETLLKTKDFVNGYILGSLFTSGYSMSLKDIKEIREYCLSNHLKFYIIIENFISEDELPLLNDYLSFLDRLNIDGLYFHDLAIINIAKRHHLSDRLIYDGQSVLCNSLDTSFYLAKGLKGVVISRELTFMEIMKILKNNPLKVDMQIFGYLRLAYSKREFISNYLNEINEDYKIKNKKSLYLIEEKRNYHLPILEDDYGTKIYSDYILEVYDELLSFKEYLNHAIVDSLFIDDKTIVHLLRDYRRLSLENKSFLKETFLLNHQGDFSSAYLYTKTCDNKDE